MASLAAGECTSSLITSRVCLQGSSPPPPPPSSHRDLPPRPCERVFWLLFIYLLLVTEHQEAADLDSVIYFAYSMSWDGPGQKITQKM